MEIVLASPTSYNCTRTTHKSRTRHPISPHHATGLSRASRGYAVSHWSSLTHYPSQAWLPLLPLRISNVHVSSISSSAHIDCLDTPVRLCRLSLTKCYNPRHHDDSTIAYMYCNPIVLRRQGWIPKTNGRGLTSFSPTLREPKLNSSQSVCHQSSQPSGYALQVAIQYYCIIATNISRSALLLLCLALSRIRSCQIQSCQR